MKESKGNAGIKARAKEEASKWKNDEKARKITELFESGYHLRDIRDSVFQNWGTGLKKDDKFFRKYTIDYIVLKVLDCADWEEYSRKQTKLREVRKKRKMAR
ncbi:MAG: hypothetical protein V1934_06560 [Methanobacteriota archaeon]